MSGALWERSWHDKDWRSFWRLPIVISIKFYADKPPEQEHSRSLGEAILKYCEEEGRRDASGNLIIIKLCQVFWRYRILLKLPYISAQEEQWESLKDGRNGFGSIPRGNVKQIWRVTEIR
ncbi:MAG: hypothetical protein LBB09_01570 [Rickettsiales bacterium]|jgi:hypothetical protein|nr:hypothetical protein [Rickettsiales bacterium]